MGKPLIDDELRATIRQWMMENYVFSLASNEPSPLNTVLAAAEEFFAPSRHTETLYKRLQDIAEEVRDDALFQQLIRRKRELKAAIDKLEVIAVCPLCGQDLQFSGTCDLLELHNTFAVRTLEYACPNKHVIFATDQPQVEGPYEAELVMGDLDRIEEELLAGLKAEAGETYATEQVLASFEVA